MALRSRQHGTARIYRFFFSRKLHRHPGIQRTDLEGETEADLKGGETHFPCRVGTWYTAVKLPTCKSHRARQLVMPRGQSVAPP